MRDFIFDISTRIFFGSKQLDKIGPEIKKYGNRVLVVYGMGSIKKNGLYDKVTRELDEHNIKYFDLGGVVPNPRISKVVEGIDLVRRENIDFILAIGGGSVIDTAKLIAVSSLSDVDPWNIVLGKEKIQKALPLGSVLTLSATGSEMDTDSVITNEATSQKLGWASEFARPKFAFMDPETTYSVNAYHTAAGTADIMSHTMEDYFSLNDGAFFQNREAEGILKTCLHYGPIAIKDPTNYEARANLMWAGSWAINGLLSKGKSHAWSVHPMEHELSAKKDITHGIGLAILTPPWLRYCLRDETAGKIAEFAYNVFGIEKSESIVDDANRGIDALKEFFHQLGINERLRDFGFNDKDLIEMANKCIENTNKKFIRGFVDLYEEDILEIYRMAL
ncbi:iron-containing alcohol dehydrogenase [Anaerococcus sp. AGMB09787]|uniref:iron-containing alcohol dehydrogenase n=1 Tax=Anaerococcus sp. AGMB09787 TaxID=2922869 RepID=UPI001FAFD112|nr:iron-containing alcohol dehydrogenase [Anaerococcus sp. AGMB09787]